MRRNQTYFVTDDLPFFLIATQKPRFLSGNYIVCRGISIKNDKNETGDFVGCRRFFFLSSSIEYRLRVLRQRSVYETTKNNDIHQLHQTKIGGKKKKIVSHQIIKFFFDKSRALGSDKA